MKLRGCSMSGTESASHACATAWAGRITQHNGPESWLKMQGASERVLCLIQVAIPQLNLCYHHVRHSVFSLHFAIIHILKIRESKGLAEE